ncbi:translocation/assembly module TamB domain-containing protein [Flavobacterium psychrotolerans]|uniref:DUF490 domain-containing protein n=1 Tax=Flavobacterium psychrotolerans TaxID=2169410 RepID=A0A2U1JG11_9FLAO|nr:translocation/assembly module TamB domain-containing protein [Flavobacterium psychrotolerans]PWA04071.1 DUF490 domain-containing protein [Flavobacterium psychrotolerans]
MLVLAIALTLPFVQTKIAQYVTSELNASYGTDINIDQISITVFGGVKLKKVMIWDYRKDTLIYANRINTTILDFKKLTDGDLLFGDVRLDGLTLNMKNYKGEKDNNLDKFIASFDSGKPSTKKFLLKASSVHLTNGRFILIDENHEVPKDVDFTRINATVSDFKIYGPDVTTKIDKMSFLDHRGLFVKNLSSQFTYTKKNILLKKMDLLTNHSTLKGDAALYYHREDFTDFNNKVQFDIQIDESYLATNDIRYFYNELGNNQHFNLKAHITGTLNNLVAKKMRLIDNKNSQIIGDVNFKNLFGNKEQYFYMKGNFDKVSSNYENLVVLLPNILGKKLPTSLKKLGQFSLSGKTEITTTSIDADFYMSTALGNIQSNLVMTNIDNIDNATYKGNIILEEFNIGSFLNKKDLRKVTLNLDVDGKGFKQKNLNTTFSGDIYKIDYNGYTYSKVIVDGNFKDPIFKGKVFINDPNLFMDFDGLVNLGKNDIAYNFHTKVDYANLKKLNFTKTDSISIFKGDIKMNVSGTNLDNLKGDVFINQTSYQNKKDTYYFDDFTINSSFDIDRLRTITINSPDIIEGKVVGKFQVNQLQKMLENSLGSLYANYKPNKIIKGQFLKFDFAIYNKIIEVFYPGIEIGKNTVFKGNINSDNDEFKFHFNSPEIDALANSFHNIDINIDNKNPLYNAYIQLDSIKTKYYKVRDFSLINVTTKDTLFLRSEFKGGNESQDYYNLNLYHTINAGGKNVVGIKKSELKFKDYLWFLNEGENKENKIEFDKALKNFSIDNIVMSHEDQKIELMGQLNNLVNKDLKLDFQNVELDKVLPSIENFKIEGKLNGDINLKQSNNIYQPTASIMVDNLNINSIVLGKLNVDIDGDDSFKKFKVNSVLKNNNLESFSANGSIDIADNKTNLDLDLNLEDFNLGILSPLGGEVISNIRGFASGKTNIGGDVNNLNINGRLFLKGAGLKIPYLNTDYNIEENATVDVTEKKFLIRNATLKDVKYQTEGKLNGSIEHHNFSDWKLDLSLNSRKLLALDTQDSEDAAYYGSAFIDGYATIKGPTNGLFIKVAAKSEKGTSIKIPINDAESVGDNSYIHFVSSSEKFNIKKGIKEQTRNYNGLELEFDFDITPDAEVEVILDRNSGHGMKGKGFGSLLFKINTLGKFNMWGDFQAYEGTYNFKYGGLINKKFDIKKGSTVVWEGDPMRAVLNIDAVYKTSANPAVLLENASFNKKVPVEVVIGLKGNLSNPNPDFEINFPTVSSILKSEIQTKLDDKDVRQKQALILLSTGGFLSADGVNQSSITNNLYQKFGDIFGNIFNDEEAKISVGVDIVSADRTPGTQTDGRFGVTVSTKINERISINGKLGVPVGGINESAIVGDVEIQYRVNQDGTLNLRGFNRENDINYIGEGIGYTQGMGISYEVDFDTFRELLRKFFKNQSIERINKSDENIQDSNLFPDDINANEKNKEKPEIPKVNKEAIPLDEE